MSSNRMMETSMNSSQGPRKIHPRRKPTESEKHFKCSCGKAYLSNESLYTHRKTKHPDEQIRQFQVPEKGDTSIQNLEKDDNVKTVIINNDTFNMLTKSAFLNFFRMMKTLADDNKEILKLFHSEKKGYTQLNSALFDTGIPAHLVYFLKSYRLHENIPDPRDNKVFANNHDNNWNNINLLTSSTQQQHGNLLPGLNKLESIELGVPLLPGMTESVGNIVGDFNLDNHIKLNESIKGFNTGNGQNEWRGNNPANPGNPVENIPEYYRDFFTIAKEMLKPMTEKFALEMCYIFNKLIELSAVQQNQKIQEYKSNNQRELLKLIANNPEAFPKFTALSQVNRETFIEQFLFNLAHLFMTGESVPD